jgi:UDP-2,3-diacylglucosamine hydrolase
LARFKEVLYQAQEQAQALFILGDLFEYWAGDDDLNSPAVRPVLHLLSESKYNGLDIYFQHGNRDFLLGTQAAEYAGLKLLADECLVEAGGQRILLLHGDTLCTDDTLYQQFRRQVRDLIWQADFLSKPLSERHAIITHLREHSEDRKSRMAQSIMDVNPAAVLEVLQRHNANTLIHGHTHRPGRHQLATGAVRWVLSDWEYDEEPIRGGVLTSTELFYSNRI